MSIDPTLESILQEIEKTDDKEQRLLLIEQYIAAFDTWLDTKGNQVEKKTLEDTLQAHEILIARSKEWLTEGAKELASYRQKTKVILAYADTLPKRLSRYRPIKS